MFLDDQILNIHKISLYEEINKKYIFYQNILCWALFFLQSFIIEISSYPSKSHSFLMKSTSGV